MPFNRDKIAFAVYRAAVAVGGRDRAPAELVAGEVAALLERRAAAAGGAAAGATGGATGVAPTVEEVQDLVEKVLIERGHARTAKAYIIYRYEHALKRRGRPSLTYSFGNIPYKVLWETLSWTVDHTCTRLADLAAAVDGGGYRALVEASEEFYRHQLDGAVAAVTARDPRPRVVIVAGPSASGKTTTTLKLRQRLEHLGWRLHAIAADNYFYDLEQHPRDPRGDYDFETPQALDLEQFNHDLTRILAGETVRIPHYDFKRGRQYPAAQPVQVDPDAAVLIDSLHGLYPELTRGIPDELKVGVYVETLSQLKDEGGAFVRWPDLRLLRRIVRDRQFRNYDARQTVLHWQYVRRAEVRHIIARLHTADAIVNSFLAYELPILKARLAGDLEALAAHLAASGDSDYDDARSRLRRVAAVFDQLPEWRDESIVPSDSLLREFIGGSSYAYE